MNCSELNIKEYPLQCDTAEAAAQLAVFLARRKFKNYRMLSALAANVEALAQ